MKCALLLSLLFSSFLSFAAERPSNILSSSLDCDEKQPKNIVTFEKIVRLENGSYWIKNIHLKAEYKFFRIKANKINKSRICKDLGFRSVAGSRIEFNKSEEVIGIDGNFNIIDHKRDEAKYILNLNCDK